MRSVFSVADRVFRSVMNLSVVSAASQKMFRHTGPKSTSYEADNPSECNKKSSLKKRASCSVTQYVILILLNNYQRMCY